MYYFVRYADLKNCLRVRVGVRVKETDHWLEVGKVKSEDGDLLEAAIARQRALIAEVRLLSFFMSKFCVDDRSSYFWFTTKFIATSACQEALSCPGERN
jgi:hypothetical protein